MKPTHILMVVAKAVWAVLLGGMVAWYANDIVVALLLASMFLRLFIGPDPVRRATLRAVKEANVKLKNAQQQIDIRDELIGVIIQQFTGRPFSEFEAYVKAQIDEAKDANKPPGN